MRIVVLAGMAALLAVPVAGAQGSHPTPFMACAGELCTATKRRECEHRERLLRRHAVRGSNLAADARLRRIALAHPGDPAYPFSATPSEQLAMA
jgi:hypothetical protein